ncbi:DUF2470 domain-containing protein [Mycena sanguinolenta]|uniref:DUF2470 domain-containing protein n=1 Tax=Mycena sanguinolenta TaxID=230812 RepID=A0A8H6YHU0_9AGAR|nr:DUF2470 domain-containing protein [Mycena sanguinolenta]
MADPAQTRKSPITSFQLPPDGLLTTVLLFTVVPYGAFAPSPTSAAGSLASLLAPAQLLRSYVLSQKTFGYIWWIAIGLHGLESLYTLSLCVRHKVPFMVSLKYWLATVFIGFPVWMDLHRRIKSGKKAE